MTTDEYGHLDTSHSSESDILTETDEVQDEDPESSQKPSTTPPEENSDEPAAADADEEQPGDVFDWGESNEEIIMEIDW